LDCDLAILCNGTTTGYRSVIDHLNRRGTDLLFLELGWFPQNSTVQIDASGINADASWVSETQVDPGPTPISLRPTSELLVLLQHEKDTQITCHSPHFREMSGFVEHLARHSEMPLRIREHPRFPAGPAVSRVAAKYGIPFERFSSLRESLQQCRTVACINSSAAVEALTQRIPVLCFGRAIYRDPSAVYCMGPQGSDVTAVTGELARGICTLSTEGVDAMVKRITEHQWSENTIRDRLPNFVENILNERSAPISQTNVLWSDHMRALPTLWTTYLYPKLTRTHTD
jgi:hypothetical protein